MTGTTDAPPWPPGCEAATSGRLDALRTLVTTYGRTPVVNRVAVVGNAPLAPDAARAATIDAADLVVRLSTFQLDDDGGAAAYGARADVVVLNRWVIASPHTFRDASRRLYLVAEQGRPFGEMHDHAWWWPSDLGPVPIPNREVTRPLATRLGLGYPDERAWATSGTLTVYLMLSLFAGCTVDLAGFSIVDQPDQTTFAHGWGPDVPVTPEHRLHAEAALLRAWVRSGRVRLLP